MAKGTGKDCSWGEQADRGVFKQRPREGEMKRGGRLVEGVGKMCVKENKREIKRGGWHRQKRGLGGFCLIKYVPMFVWMKAVTIAKFLPEQKQLQLWEARGREEWGGERRRGGVRRGEEMRDAFKGWKRHLHYHKNSFRWYVQCHSEPWQTRAKAEQGEWVLCC